MSGDEQAGAEGTADDTDVEEALEGQTGADDGSDAEVADVAPAEEGAESGQSGEDDVPSGETVEIAVPSNLLRAWEHRADHAKLSISEYIVRMTEAGRMSVQMEPAGASEGGAAMSVEQLTDDVVDQLRHEDAVSWEQLVDAISHNLEEQLEEALERLQDDDVVRYSGLKGGYVLVEDED